MGHSRGGASTKIHAVVDAYGYPIRLMISEGQKNDITYAIPLLELIDIEGSHVLAEKEGGTYPLLDLFMVQQRWREKKEVKTENL